MHSLLVIISASDASNAADSSDYGETDRDKGNDESSCSHASAITLVLRYDGKNQTCNSKTDTEYRNPKEYDTCDSKDETDYSLCVTGHVRRR